MVLSPKMSGRSIDNLVCSTRSSINSNFEFCQKMLKLNPSTSTISSNFAKRCLSQIHIYGLLLEITSFGKIRLKRLLPKFDGSYGHLSKAVFKLSSSSLVQDFPASTIRNRNVLGIWAPSVILSQVVIKLAAYQIPVQIALFLRRHRLETTNQIVLLGAGQHRRQQLLGLDEQPVRVGSIHHVVQVKLVAQCQADFSLAKVSQATFVVFWCAGCGPQQAQQRWGVALKIKKSKKISLKK